MNKMKRRLLSLLMAVVMVCTLVPAGLAEDEGKPIPAPKGIDWTEDCGCEHTGDDDDDDCSCTEDTHETVIKVSEDGATCTEDGEAIYKCACHTECQAEGTLVLRATGHDWGSDGKCRNEDCTAEATVEKITLNQESLKLDLGSNKTATLKATCTPSGVDFKITWTSSNEDVAAVENGKVTAVGKGSAEITAACGDVTATCKVTVGDSFAIDTPHNDTITKDTFTNLNQYITFRVVSNNKAISADDYSVKWTMSDSAYFHGEQNGVQFTLEPVQMSSTRRSCTVNVEVTEKSSTTVVYEDKYTVYLQIEDNLSLKATVNDEYYFDDVSNSGKYSVYDQLIDQLGDYHGSTSKWTLDRVVFSKTTSSYGDLENVPSNGRVYGEDFGDVKFVPTKKGDAVFSFTAYVTNNYYEEYAHTGTLTITVTDTVTGGDVIFYGAAGDDVYMDSTEFDDYWDSKFPGGVLDYVTFGSVSGGSLLDADGKSVGSRKFYADAARTQYDIDDVYFRPNSTNAKKAVTISFAFTAYGENKSGAAKEAAGTVNIVYMSKSPSDIKYTVGSDNTVSLKASDFTAAYKEATGSTAPSNLTIEFQGVPKNGTLTYTDSSKKNASAVNLTSSNIRSRSFTTKSSGTNQIGDVVYRNTASSTDTIEYVAYSGNTAKFKGSVVFSGKAVPADITVTYQSVNGLSVNFSWTDFTSKNSALTSATKVRFTSPANGTLYLNGGAFAASTGLLVTQVSSVTYVPRTGSNAQEKLTFVATDANDQTVGSGTVIINVSGNTVTNPNGITSASQFKDVTAGAWYYTYLDDLVRKGIFSGRDDGSFDPNGTVTYGEALKLVLEAAGYHAEALTGNDWAINYKNLAVQNGWISNNISLTAPISRLATAELIARVLGLSRYTGESPFADTTDGYAGALYYTNPQIFIGDTNPNGGKPLFLPQVNNVPQTTLTRAQVCTVIYRLNTYYQNNQNNQNNNTTTEINPATGLPYGI